MPIRDFQVRRFPQWIRRALNLTETEVPSTLVAERDELGVYSPIQPTIDAFQGGIAIGDPIVVPGTLLTMTGGSGNVLNIVTGENGQIPGPPAINFTVDPNSGYIIFALEMSVNSAAPRSPVFAISTAPAFTGDVGVRISQVQQPAGIGVIPWAQLMNGGAPFFVPPGWVPIIFTGDMLIGETVNVFASLMRIPAGFKPY